MGGLCSVPGMPSVDIDMNEVESIVNDNLTDIIKTAEQNILDYPDQIEKSTSRTICS